MKALRVGITGGIGSGKTTVCKIWETLDIPIYYADDRAKLLMNSDKYLISEIKYLFGPEAYHEGVLNRRYIAFRVFSDTAQLALLNGLVHPAVARDAQAWHDAQRSPYTLHEAALTIEIGGHRALDALIVVTAPEETRIQRVMDRDGTTREQVLARMDTQLPQADKDALADYLINNDGQHALIPQIQTIHRVLTQRARGEDHS